MTQSREEYWKEREDARERPAFFRTNRLLLLLDHSLTHSLTHARTHARTVHPSRVIRARCLTTEVLALVHLWP